MKEEVISTKRQSDTKIVPSPSPTNHAHIQTPTIVPTTPELTQETNRNGRPKREKASPAGTNYAHS